MATDFLVKQGKVMGGVRLVTDADVAHQTDLTNIRQTGTTSSQAISAGKYFYLNNVLVKAKVDIANGAIFTLNTNYEDVTAGALNELNDRFNYSETEQYGGKWIDGSDWYYKTINCGALPNATTKSVAHGISNLKDVIKCEGMFTNGRGWFAINNPNPTGLTAQVQCSINSTNVNIVTATNLTDFNKSWVTLYYTKTS